MDGSLAPLSLRAQNKLATRNRILQAAKAAFEMKGYSSIDLRTIAVSAGLSTGAIFSHFANKAALYEAATGRTAPTPAMMDAAAEMLDALKALLPANVDLNNTRWPDSATLPCDVPLGELRAAASAIAAAEGRANG